MDKTQLIHNLYYRANSITDERSRAGAQIGRQRGKPRGSLVHGVLTITRGVSGIFGQSPATAACVFACQKAPTEG